MLNLFKSINTKRGVMFGIECRALKKQFGELFLASMQSVDSEETHGASINNTKNSTKRGVMFGIDARVTFAVTAIAAFIVGVNQFTGVDSSNKESAELDLREIKNSTLSYYNDKYTVPANVNTLITSSYLQLFQKHNVDPWGNAYVISSVAQDETIGSALMNTKYIVLTSLGKNGVLDTTAPTTYAQWLTLEASSDDIMLKFDTKEIEKKIAETETLQLKVIENLISNYVSTKKQELATFCSNASNHRDYNCDVNKDKIYYENEESQLNFMLKDIDDDNGKYYLVKHSINGSDAKFKSGYINTSSNTNYNMYSFMSQIGGASEYVKSPRGLTLHFSSNKYGNTKFPYFAEIWYDNEVTIF